MGSIRVQFARAVAAAVLSAVLVATAPGAGFPGPEDSPAGAASYDRLIAEKAVAEGFHLLPAVRSRLEARLNGLWADAYWAEAVRPTVRLDEADVLAAAPPAEDVVSLQQLIVASRDEAIALRERALAGEDFGEIAKTRSVGLSAFRGGTTGFVRRSSRMYPPDLMEALFAMAPGDISPVSETAVGFAVVRVVRKRTAEEQRREWAAENREKLLAARGREVWEARKERLAASHDVAVDEDTLAAYRDARAGAKAFGPLLERVAATVDGVSLLLGDVVDPSGLGVAHGPDAVASLVRRRVEEFAVAREADRIGLRGRFPDIARREAVLRESILAREYVKARTRGLDATEAELRAYYEDNRASFAEARTFDLSFIETTSPERATAALDLLGQGVPFGEAADRLSDNRVAPGGRYGFVAEDRLAPGLAAVKGLRAGEYVTTPLRVPGIAAGEELYVIARLNGVREGRIVPYDEVDRSLLASRLMARKREAAIREIVAEAAKGR